MSLLLESLASFNAGRAPQSLLLASALFFAACGGGEKDGELGAPLPLDAAVSANTPEATLAGLEILSRGGNAVDAAVAVSLMLGVTEPSQSGLGGSVVMMILPKEGSGAVVIHPPSRGEVAAAAGSVPGAAAPAALRVLHQAWSRYGSGRVSWEDLFEPAVRTASQGHRLGRFHHRTILNSYDQIVEDRGSAQLLLSSDRSIPAESSLRTNPDLAAVLEQIARGGPEAFYTGETGSRIVSVLSRKGVPLTAAQLAATPAAVESPALRGSYRDRTIWAAPEPYGGRYLLEALRFLELAPEQWIRAQGWVRTAWLAEALSFAWKGGGVHPVQQLAALPPMPAPVEGGGAPATADSSARDSAPTHATLPVADAPATDSSAPRDSLAAAGSPSPEGAGATTHFSVIDAFGMAVSVTQTLGGPFGSGLVDGLGFFYQLSADDAGEAALVAPTIVTQDSQVVLVLGSPGGERGLAAVFQVLVRALDLGEPIEDAVMAHRLYVSRPSGSDRGRLFLEGVVWEDSLSVQGAAYARWGDSLDAGTRQRGFTMGERHGAGSLAGLDPWFGGVNAIGWTGTGWSAVGDERRDGVGGLLVRGAPTLQGSYGSATEPAPGPEG